MSKKNRNKNRKKRQTSSAKSTKATFPLLPAVVVLGAIAVVGYFAFQDKDTNNASQIATANISSPASLKGGETKAVLSPARFVGKTASAYKVAKDNPELLDHMYCYCYCAKTIGHKSLLSCFTDNHAKNCTICQDQAFYAKSLSDKGYDLIKVRQGVDKKYWKPFS
jgi:hypothetical protein